jgi:hypothetical protein
MMSGLLLAAMLSCPAAADLPPMIDTLPAAEPEPQRRPYLLEGGLAMLILGALAVREFSRARKRG